TPARNEPTRTQIRNRPNRDGWWLLQRIVGRFIAKYTDHLLPEAPYSTSSRRAATVAPSQRTCPASVRAPTATAGSKAFRSASVRDSSVTVEYEVVAPIPRSTTRPAQ